MFGSGVGVRSRVGSWGWISIQKLYPELDVGVESQGWVSGRVSGSYFSPNVELGSGDEVRSCVGSWDRSIIGLVFTSEPIFLKGIFYSLV